MPRTREFEPTEALEQVMALFWERGYADTSMEEIVDATGVSRYGLYGTFGNKRELYIAALQRYADQISEEFHPNLFTPQATRADLEDFIDGAIDRCIGPDGHRGCMVCNTAIEIAPHDATIAAAVRDLYDQLANAFATAIQNSQLDGHVNPKVDPKPAGELLVATTQGMVVMARAGTSKTRLKAHMDAALAMLD